MKKQTVKLFVYTINDKVFRKGYNKLSDGQIITETFEDNYIKGTVVTKYDGILYTSIPYDKGWSVIIDGETVAEEDIHKIGQAMLGVNIQRGSHTVEFRYEAQGLKTGFAVSLVTLLILLEIALVSKIRRSKSKKPLLPVFPKMGYRYSEKVFLPEKIKLNFAPVTTIENVNLTDVFSNYTDLPKREIITPDIPVKREIISPANESNTEQ